MLAEPSQPARLDDDPVHAGPHDGGGFGLGILPCVQAQQDHHVRQERDQQGRLENTEPPGWEHGHWPLRHPSPGPDAHPALTSIPMKIGTGAAHFRGSRSAHKAESQQTHPGDPTRAWFVPSPGASSPGAVAEMSGPPRWWQGSGGEASARPRALSDTAARPRRMQGSGGRSSSSLGFPGTRP